MYDAYTDRDRKKRYPYYKEFEWRWLLCTPEVTQTILSNIKTGIKTEILCTVPTVQIHTNTAAKGGIGLAPRAKYIRVSCTNNASAQVHRAKTSLTSSFHHFTWNIFNETKLFILSSPKLNTFLLNERTNGKKSFWNWARSCSFSIFSIWLAPT